MIDRFAPVDRLRKLPPGLLLALAVLCNTGLGALVIAHDHYEVPLHQFVLGSDELLQSHRIATTFLPIGYPVLLAGAFAAGRLIHIGDHGGLFALNLLLSAVTLLLGSYLLRLLGVERVHAVVIAFLVSAYPELLHNLSKVSDTNLTAVLILALVVAFLMLRERPSISCAALAGLTLGAAVLVRPNMVLLSLLLVLALRKPEPLKRRVLLAAVSCTVAALLFAGVTAAVHGAPFFPENGPYNTFAGNNPYTEQALRTHQNGEASIVRALHDDGVSVVMNWDVPSDQPGIADARDLKYKPLYTRETRRFWREHPGDVVRLWFWKLWAILTPETNRYGFDSPKTPSVVLWLAQKVVSALIVPAWLCLMFLQWHRHLRATEHIVAGTVILYMLPFVLVNSDPRFRMLLAVLLLLDGARLALHLRDRIEPALPQTYLTSAPRPAA